MRRDTIAAILIALISGGLFTFLLVKGYIPAIVYASLVAILAVVCLAIVCLQRITEIDMKNLRLVLQAKKAIDDFAKMYGGIERFMKAPMALDDDKMRELGLQAPGGLAKISAVMRYTAGCIKRERERLAQIFVNEKTPEALAQAILDPTLDDSVFRWAGPEKTIDSVLASDVIPEQANPEG